MGFDAMLRSLITIVVLLTLVGVAVVTGLVLLGVWLTNHLVWVS